ncbi:MULTISPECIES: type II CAAX endopeptidase family protein [unclassified Stenotrophomonas]|uniref:CPBP family intramembrane glutamic endopeptidase n=1 Tax=unclassified Stenotrophomonas TaxID=196198 RepID=UPI00177F5927|nr:MULTISPECIES: type II CAAX endopeptidase family protein [unclassified Stenotrophomonas]MBD8637377.1 CPBP family intramembrane metalloprotease [Stenotrophomonas sp. CFBP 13725]MBD8697366.1 CPBP family intramembrane metalloprotease [Stenotrophomonas sp. CFBP 13718]
MAISLCSRVHPIQLGDQRVLRPGRFRWLRALAWVVALFVLVVMSSMSTGQLLGTLLPKTSGPAQLLGYVGSVLVGLGIYALAVRFGEGRRPSEIALRSLLPEVLLGLLLGAAMFAAVMAIMAVCSLYDITFTGPAPAWIAAGKALQAGVIEELMLRAILLRLVWRAFGPWIAFAVSAALFGFGHMPNPNATVFAAVCIALEAGIMLAAFYALTGRIWMSIGVHAAWNFTQGYVFGAAVSGSELGPAIARSTAVPGMPEWLTGGAFGPEASLPGLAVCLAIGALVMWRAWRMGRFAR